MREGSSPKEGVAYEKKQRKGFCCALPLARDLCAKPNDQSLFFSCLLSCFAVVTIIIYLMASATGQSRNAYWNPGNDVTLKGLVKRHRISPNLRIKNDLYPIFLKYFSHIPYRNFHTHFLKNAAQ